MHRRNAVITSVFRDIRNKRNLVSQFDLHRDTSFKTISNILKFLFLCRIHWGKINEPLGALNLALMLSYAN